MGLIRGIDNRTYVRWSYSSFHHKLVHGYGWGIRGGAENELRWFRGDGSRYRADPQQPDGSSLALAS